MAADGPPAAEPTLWQSMRRLMRFVPVLRRRQLAFVMAVMLLGAFAEMLTLGTVVPFLALLADPTLAGSFPIAQKLFSAFGWTDPANLVVPATLLFATVALAAGAVRLVLAWASTRLVFGLGHDLGVQMFARIMQQPYLFHVARNSSEQIAAVPKIDGVVTGFLYQIMILVSASVLALFIFAALVLIDPTVALSAAAGFSALYLTITYLTRRQVRSNSQTYARSQGLRVKALQEGLGGIRDVIIDRTHPIFIERYAAVDESLRKAQARNAFIAQAPRFVIEAAGMVIITVIALLMSARAGGLAAALPVLGALALGAQRLLPLLQQIFSGWTTMGIQRQALADILAILELKPASAPVEPERPLPFREAITLDRVTFRYAEADRCVLDDVSLTIPKGARVGFIGKTGSGKSTLLDIVMGLVPVTGGAVKVDGEPLREETLAAWRAQIAHVPQNIFLADASIASNIAFGVAQSEIDMDRVREAARRADIATFIESLPRQYGHVVGERGIRLSGGQRQRLGIARALYKKAELLVFDEATSALDTETESAVMRAIEALDRNLTLLIIAHRLTTVAKCDAVVELCDGRIVSVTHRAGAASPATAPRPDRLGSIKRVLNA